MGKKVYSKGTFGAYLNDLLQRHSYTQSAFVLALNISKTYFFDILNGRQKPPAPEMQERIIGVLNLKEEERQEFYDQAAKGRHELPKDIVDFLINNPQQIKELRQEMEERK